MHFTGMKITGFKSFVEPTHFAIEPGLTGVVGPNGCGKSNVVEALRWTMGENSAKRLRGGEMDDVIFSGSAGRPARNIAEVTLLLDNRQRQALAEFNNDDVIEVSRRIDRGLGSEYRINGRPVRQKDVQLLFADQATGAHSTSIVSQGRVAALIQAKPEERRQVLEEAAGISGLHARRHEAELKLKAAEANLTRSADQLQAMEQQFRALKGQVRQASRYRNLGALIRKCEASLLYLQAKQTEVNVRLLEDSLAKAEIAVRDLSSAVTVLVTERTEAAAGLPPLRHAEAAASAVVQRLFLETETLEKESQRLTREQEEVTKRLTQAVSDRAREETQGHEAIEALQRLAEEEKNIQQRLKEGTGSGKALETASKMAAEAAAAGEKRLEIHTHELAAARAAAAEIERFLKACQEDETRLEARRKEIETQLKELRGEIARLPDIAGATEKTSNAEKNLARLQEEAGSARAARDTAEKELAHAREARQKAWAERTRAEAEIEALAKILKEGVKAAAPVGDQVEAPENFLAALAAGLGESLSAGLDEKDGLFWQALPPLSGFFGGHDLPKGAKPLATLIQAPQALARALSQIGFVEDEAIAERLAHDLKPGQALVTQSGAAWRWDGYTQKAGAETQTKTRLKERARQTALEGKIAGLAAEAEKTEARLRETARSAEEKSAADNRAREALAGAFAALDEARRELGMSMNLQADLKTREVRLRETGEAIAEERSVLQEKKENTASQQKTLANIAELETRLEAARKDVATARQLAAEKQAAFAGFARESETLRARAAQIGQDRASWQARVDSAASHAGELQRRETELRQEAKALAEKPAALEAQRKKLLSQSQEAETARRKAADALLTAENALNAIEKNVRNQEEALSSSKESRVRAEEQMYQARHAYAGLIRKSEEGWHCAPDQLLKEAGVADTVKLASQEQLEQDYARLTKERDNMGPVNLRADMEAGELETHLARMNAERADLTAAISKLRQGISQLNREARERLSSAFAEVNKHFIELFARLFGGGKAHLKLIDSDDPLDAGLEIFASPPGKRLQALSLLSGGEQALTAVALLFAIFLVNPAPICVLDEVDAPLDEANVERFCALVRDMAEGGAKNGHTRFLIITHHRLTMARMDRLYGVTMAEKGVSQLVSVDLKQALALRETDESGEIGGEGDLIAAA